LRNREKEVESKVEGEAGGFESLQSTLTRQRSWLIFLYVNEMMEHKHKGRNADER
jgi:hypothetical protein